MSRKEGPGPDERLPDIDDEIGYYLERRTQELVERGVPRDEAERAARERFGDVGAIRDQCRRIQRRRRRRAWRAAVAERVLADVRFAARALRRRPAYAALAVFTLALGVGANTAIFSVVDAVLLRPLPYPQPDRLARVWQTQAGGTRSASPADFLDWRREQRAFVHLAAFDQRARNLMGGERPERVTLGRVSGNFFATMGVDASRGRTFGPDEVRPGEEAAVLSHALWVRAYGADPAVIGTSLRLDDETFPIVGVMPPTFDYPSGTELWVGATWDVPGIRNLQGDIRQLRDAWYFDVVGRMREDVTLDDASADMAAVTASLARRYPDTNAGTGARVRSLHESTVAAARPTLLLLFGAVALVLLIACANVANLALVRATLRRRELAVRSALGASRRGIVAHVLAESAVLAVAGGAFGVVLAVACVRLLDDRVATTLPLGVELSVNGSVLAYTVLLAAATLLLFGALPAWVAGSARGSQATAGRGDDGGGTRGRRLRSALVATEVALAIVLLLGASLTLRSLWNLQDVDLGFDPAGLTTLWVAQPRARAMSVPERSDFYGRVESGVASLPGVTSAGWASTDPLSSGPGAGLRVVGRDEAPGTQWQMVTESYFATLGLRILAGRGFSPTDDHRSERVAVVNETFARAVFPGEDPLGYRINTGLDGRSEDGEWLWVTIVGVVEDTRNRGPAEATRPMMYRPLRQGSNFFRGEAMMLAVRTEADSPELLARVRDVVGRVDSDAPIYAERTGAELAARFSTDRRLVLASLGVFAAIALGLGAVGIYGVTAYAVSNRTREIGIRVALGAPRRRVVRLVLGQALVPSLLGIAAGVLMGIGSGRYVESLLFELTPTDPATYVVVAVGALAATLLATWVPARRAARVDPRAAIGA